VRPGGLGTLQTIHLVGSRTRDLPTYSIVPLPLRYRVRLFPYTVLTSVLVMELRCVYCEVGAEFFFFLVLRHCVNECDLGSATIPCTTVFGHPWDSVYIRWQTVR
jgi:hypothetical protein